MSNASILSKDSATLSAANKKMALNRKVNPLLKPLGRPSIDGKSSKHSYSENNSVISDQDQDELTMDDIEKLLSSTQAKMSELTKEFQFINSSIPEKTAWQANPVLPQIPKPSSGKGVRPTPNLDSLLSTTGVNPLPRAGSKTSFSIKSTRQQRSLSRQKK
jgi:hypothetical protein